MHASVPEAGQIVRVRQRRYLVEEVVLPSQAADATLVRLACLDDDAQGRPLAALWELEQDAEVLQASGWERLSARGFDAPKIFSAYLHTLRWNCVTATNPKLFQAPFRAGIRIDHYQLEPLRKALLLPRVNLFIADDVGLGKTIEAGLIARELLLRKKVRDVVVACPPSVLVQWQEELETRFGLTFQVLDRDYVQTTRRERGWSTNPWAAHTRFLISQRLLVDEQYAAPLRDWLGDFRPGSLLILDEAHHAAPAAGSRYAIDSKFTRAIRDLAPRFEHRLFLSATPHNGHSNSFSALLEILDPQRFCRGVPVKGKKLLDDVMVRRLKEDVRAIQGGFPERRVVQLDVDGLPDDAPELRLSTLLDRYRSDWEERLQGAAARKRDVGKLLVSGLQQRLLSSIEAFARTLAVHRRTLERQQAAGSAPVAARVPEDLFSAPDADDDRAELPPEQLQHDDDAQIEAATDALREAPGAAGESLLEEMTRVAAESRRLPDARVRLLVEWIKTNLLLDARRWGDRRVLIFTEYEDTLRWLQQQLEAAVSGTDREEERIAVYRGSTPAIDRKRVKQAFNAPPQKHPLRILLCTDAAREGINLPDYSVIVGGLETWSAATEEVHEPRLVEKLKRHLDAPQLKLFAPPAAVDDPTAPRTGVAAWQFPEWFVTQDAETARKGSAVRSRRLVHRRALTHRKFIDDQKKKHPVVPIRFVRACRKGHIGDVDWYGFVHQGASACRQQLWIDERGTSGDLGEIIVRCECGRQRRLSDAALTAQKLLGSCDGDRPWLGPPRKEACGEPNRLLVRSASNAYFTQLMSVISLPDKNESVEKAVGGVYAEFLANLDDQDDLRFVRKKMPPVKAALEGFSDEEVWAEVLSRKGGASEAEPKSVKLAEFEVLSGVKESAGIDEPDGDFYARALPRKDWDGRGMESVERVVLVHRLREVSAQVGFTRFEAAGPNIEGELEMGVQAADLAHETTWLPAVENRGEGFFLQFRKDRIDAWAAQENVRRRGERLDAGFQAWKAEHPQSGREFPGLPYYLLHTISHMLLTAASLECGYPASSIRERVYALEAGYGILLYTGTPDAEGTLGGLVETGRRIAHHLQTALEAARLCSNDPVCAQHDPPASHEARYLQGASCHGCLFVSETSCEQHNDFLDRALAVPTVDDLGTEFFTT